MSQVFLMQSSRTSVSKHNFVNRDDVMHFLVHSIYFRFPGTLAHNLNRHTMEGKHHGFQLSILLGDHFVHTYFLPYLQAHCQSYPKLQHPHLNHLQKLKEYEYSPIPCLRRFNANFHTIWSSSMLLNAYGILILWYYTHSFEHSEVITEALFCTVL